MNLLDESRRLANVYGWEQYRRKLDVCQADGRQQK
jgi:hypothetical protein